MSYVQSKDGVQGAGTTLVLTYTNAVVAGHCLLAFIRLSNGSDVITGISDTVNGAWTRIARIVHTSGSVSSYVYKFTGTGAGTPTVTMTASSSQSFRGAIAEYTEADVDQIVSGTLASSSSPVSGSVTAQANATVVGFLSIDSGTTTFTAAGSPVSTSRQDITVASTAANMADLGVSSGGGYTISWTLGAAKVSAYIALSMLPPTTKAALFTYYRNQMQ